MARYAGLLKAELAKRGYETKLVRPTPLSTRLVSRSSGLFRWLGYLDKFVFFPPILWLRAHRADVVHVCDHSNSMYLRWVAGKPNVITAHDALAIRSALGHFPQNVTRRSGVMLQRWILRGLKRADRIVCVSEKTRRDFEALLPEGPAMTVIPNPLAGDFRRARSEDVERIRESCGIEAEGEYLLHVGKNNWYKNRPGVLRIVKELRKFPRFSGIKLVMAGGRLPESLRAEAANIGGVAECDAPSDAQLRALYTGALALLYPSLEEGFGWPIVEAQACGCPVITSDRAPMNEVAGRAAILIDPEDAPGAAAVIADRIGEPEALVSKGWENVRRYSVESALDRYCEVYRELNSSAGKTAAGKA